MHIWYDFSLWENFHKIQNISMLCYVTFDVFSVCHSFGLSATGTALFIFRLVPQQYSFSQKICLAFLIHLLFFFTVLELTVVFVDLRNTFLCQNADFLIIFLSARFSLCKFVCLIFNVFFCVVWFVNYFGPMDSLSRARLIGSTVLPCIISIYHHYFSSSATRLSPSTAGRCTITGPTAVTSSPSRYRTITNGSQDSLLSGLAVKISFG